MTNRTNRKYEVRRDPFGYAAAITHDGWDVLHLVPGSVRNEENIDQFVADIQRGNQKYEVRRDPFGYAAAITLDGVDIIHLIPGSLRNEENIDSFVNMGR